MMEGKKGWKRTILKATAGNTWQLSSVYNGPWWEKHAIRLSTISTLSTLKGSIEQIILIILGRHEPLYRCGTTKKYVAPE